MTRQKGQEMQNQVWNEIIEVRKAKLLDVEN